MPLRFMYWSTPDSRELINTVNNFCHVKNIGISTPNKVFHIEGPRMLRFLDKAGNESVLYEIGLAVDVGQPQRQRDKLNTVDNVTFNVMDEKQKQEIEQLKQQKEEAPTPMGP